MECQAGTYLPTVIATWASRVGNAPEGHRNASVARVNKTLLRLASTLAEMTPMIPAPFAYIQEKYSHNKRKPLTVPNLRVISF